MAQPLRDAGQSLPTVACRVSQSIDAGAPQGTAGEGRENADAEARPDRPLSLREELEAAFRGLVICGATAARRVT